MEETSERMNRNTMKYGRTGGEEKERKKGNILKSSDDQTGLWD